MFTPRLKYTSAVAMGLAVAALVGSQLDVTWNRDAQAEPSTQVSVPTIPPPDEFQLRALSDGVVSESEVREAIARAAACMAEQGVQALPLDHPQLEGNLVLGRFVPEGEDPAKGAAVMRECSERFEAHVTSAYRVQRRAAGLDTPPPPPAAR